MFALLRFFLALFSSLFKSKSRLEAENAALRRQLIVLQRKVRGRLHFTNSDRLFLIQLYRWFPLVLKVITIIRPETVVRWHRAAPVLALEIPMPWGEAHLRRILGAYATAYYNVLRTHRSLEKDAPFSRPVQPARSIHSHAILGGLHHHYVRV